MHVVVQDQKTGKSVKLCYDRNSGVVRLIDYSNIGDVQILMRIAKSLDAPAIQAIVEEENVDAFKSVGWKESKGLRIMEVEL